MLYLKLLGANGLESDKSVQRGWNADPNCDAVLTPRKFEHLMRIGINNESVRNVRSGHLKCDTGDALVPTPKDAGRHGWGEITRAEIRDVVNEPAESSATQVLLVLS